MFVPNRASMVGLFVDLYPFSVDQIVYFYLSNYIIDVGKNTRDTLHYGLIKRANLSSCHM